MKVSLSFEKGYSKDLSIMVDALRASTTITIALDKFKEIYPVYTPEEAIEIASKNVGKKDYKTVLQEKLQENGSVHIEYSIIKEEGPDHDKTFTAEVKCNGKKLAIGTGSTKKHAEMDAAHKALVNMKNK